MPAYPPPGEPPVIGLEDTLNVPTVIPPEQMPDWPKPPPPVEG